jgi:hypothetical protein
MDNNNNDDINIMEDANTVAVAMTGIPGTICPPLLHSTRIPHTVDHPPLSESTPALPTIPQLSPGPTRPLKRYVRPRAKDDEEKHSRAEERKIANRTAAKISRERQKQAMHLAQQENDRLKAENNALLERLAGLEQRVQTMEERKTRYPEQGSGGEVKEVGGRGATEQTYQPARPMMLDQQCPVPGNPCRLNLGIVVYALQMLMHSFALSMVLKTHLEARGLRMRTTATTGTNKSGMNIYSPWIQFPGDATPNSLNLSGALRNQVSRRVNIKTLLNTPIVHRIQSSKEFLRRVRRDNNNTRRRRRGQGKPCIRLIVKKKPSSSSSGKRMNNK